MIYWKFGKRLRNLGEYIPQGVTWGRFITDFHTSGDGKEKYFLLSFPLPFFESYQRVDYGRYMAVVNTCLGLEWTESRGWRCVFYWAERYRLKKFEYMHRNGTR